MLRAGVVGLGQMGGGAAVCLAKAGRPLAVYDINPQAAPKWEDGHLVPPVLPNCREVARNADVVDGSTKYISLRQNDCMRRVGGKWTSFFEMISFPVDQQSGKAILANPTAFK